MINCKLHDEREREERKEITNITIMTSACIKNTQTHTTRYLPAFASISVSLECECLACEKKREILSVLHRPGCDGIAVEVRKRIT
jgi:hypothetical protein